MRKRRDAGKSMEPMVLLALALALSLGVGYAWPPWGYFAGPVAVALLVGGAFLAFLISEARAKGKSKP